MIPVSRGRIRPTRDETRQRLFEAAADVFARQGVGAATIEQIASAAGFTRGAFYSNFADKEELVVAMLEDHLRHSVVRNLELLETHPEPAGFVEALRANEGRDDPLHRWPVLQIELMLHAARRAELRPPLGEHLRTMRNLVGEIVNSTLRAAGVESELDPHELGTLVVAIEDGLRLHRLIDPDSTPEDAFFEALESLRRLVLARSEARP